MRDGLLDRQREEQLRKTAELQLMRLNQILEVLTDPLLRAKYDESIRPTIEPLSEIPQIAPPWRSFHNGYFGIGMSTILWSAALVLGAIGFSCTLLFFDHGPAIAVYEGNGNSSRASGSPLESAPTPPQLIQRPRNERDGKQLVHAPTLDSSTFAPVVPVEAAGTAEDPSMNPLPATPVIADLPSPSAPLSAPVIAIHADRPPDLRGTWLYSKSNKEAEMGGASSYRPFYIEMVVKPLEDHKIAGRYLGRFQVPDQALSSEVNFTFEGTVAEGPTALPWHSGDGTEGQVRIKMVSYDLVEVSWYTTRFGTTRSLASGIAILRRN